MYKLIFCIIIFIFSIGKINATPLYQDDNNSLDLSGWLGVALLDEQSSELVDNSSRVNFTFQRNEKDGWSSFATTEWGLI